jgi:hypothetical protein
MESEVVWSFSDSQGRTVRARRLQRGHSYEATLREMTVGDYPIEGVLADPSSFGLATRKAEEIKHVARVLAATHPEP